MATIEGIVVHRDGRAYVKYTSVLIAEPTRVHLYWLLDCAQDATCEGDVAIYRGEGSWKMHAPKAPGALGYLRRNANGAGNAVAAIKEKEPIPAPKVRAGVHTRWNGYSGVWEKLLKKGWVAA